jgi:tRNA 2-thiouridine synthesizing protein D
MKFFIIINGAPWSSPASLTALKFAEAVVDSGHDIYRLFFFQDGVHNASAFAVAPQDEIDIPKRWLALIDKHQLDAVVCAASALKHGLLDAGEAVRYDKDGHNLLPSFEISGIGQLVDALTQADRVVNFVS